MYKVSIRNFSKVSLLALCLTAAGSSFAQTLKITPTSRFLADAATFSDKNVDLTEGVGVRDFRMGLKAYYGDFFMKADASFVSNKVSLKDIYLQYSLNDKALVRAGHFTVPFGLQSAYGTAHKQFMDQPSSNVYQIGRRVGLMHTLWNDKFWLSYGAFADNKALTQSTDVSGKQGYTISERFVYKPICTKDYLLQAGISLLHMNAEANGKDEPRSFTYKVPYLTSVDKTSAVYANVNDARYENKYTVELAGIYKNFVFESQYYGSNIKRTDSPSFKSNGFYAVARGIVLNKANYKYSSQTAGIGVPNDKALEVALGYSLTNMNDSKAGIYGGKMNDVSAGVSFYWNKYITLRSNYSYITVKTTKEDPTKKVHAIQCRVQYYF